MFKTISQQLKKPFMAIKNAKSNPRAKNAAHLQSPWANDEAQHPDYLSSTESDAILYRQSPTFCQNLAGSLREMTERRILREHARYYGDMNKSLRSQKSVASLLYPDQPVESHTMAKQLAKTARVLRVPLETLLSEMADFLADLRDPKHELLAPIIDMPDELSRQMKSDKAVVERMFINDPPTQQSLIQAINRMILVHSPPTTVAAGEGSNLGEEGISLWIQGQKRMQRSMHAIRKYDMPRWMLGTADVKDTNMQSHISGADAAQKRQELGDKTTNHLEGYTKRAKEAEERREALRRLKQQSLGRLKRSKE